MTTLTWDRHHGHAHTYDVVALGNNYRIDEIRSALGLVQLGKLAGNNARRKVITERYQEGLKGSIALGVGLPFRNVPGTPAYHIFPMLLPAGMDRIRFMESMRSAGVQTSIHYPPVHQFTYYRQRYPELALPVTEKAAAREVTLPLYPGLHDEDVDWVLSAVEEALTSEQVFTPSG
jgi:dTDP-4-amino-4,6-dideoxygalactose transaminase